MDIFLPFWWVTRHLLQGAWTNAEICINSPICLEKCTKYETNEFELTYDEAVCIEPSALIIGHVSVVNDDPLGKVSMEFHQYLGIMSKKAADALPEH